MRTHVRETTSSVSDTQTHHKTAEAEDTEDKTGDSSEFKMDVSDHWTKPSELQPTLKCNRVPVSGKRPTTGNRKQFSCSVCGKRFSNKTSLKIHMITHSTDKPTVCGRSFSQKGNLVCHMQRHTEEKKYNCTVCGRRFKFKEDFGQHMKIHKPETQSTSCVSAAKKQPGESFSLNREEPEFRNPDPHLQPKDKTGDSSEVSNGLKESPGRQFGLMFWKNTEVPAEKAHSCSLCGKRFINECTLRDHMIQHTDTPFSCSVCGKGFSQKETLERHMPHHTGENNYSCTVCGRRFRFQGDVGRHMAVHAKYKPTERVGNVSIESREPQSTLKSQKHTDVQAEDSLSCSFCGKTFTRKFCLKVHIRLHTGEKPFSCSVCGKRFVQRYHYLEHTRLHTGEGTFDCSLCGRKFGHMFRLRNHMTSHTGEKPFSCSVCGKGFRFNGELKSHALVHSGEKPFSCSVCLRGFRLKFMLTSHMTIHSGELPFSCSFCGRRFRQKGNLKTHMKKHETEAAPAAELKTKG
ncbi:gastrula zinc finger protein XlCGF57.1-like [Etheostoma cragini]|uniref:gastrula zinc finger protein XlCGF57.1-like n=1 Tax=Etheostoma cragini TaxID=417921 RepID=UPI00155DF944|nr:gastrula zinc finger protein XlCGF57.1-like [Etheostoma cragini]